MSRRLSVLLSLVAGLACAPDAPMTAEPAATAPAPASPPTVEPSYLPPAIDFPTHRVAEMIAEGVLAHHERGDDEALAQAAIWAVELASQAEPQDRFAHQLHAYTQRLAHGPAAEAAVVATLPLEEPALYRYFFHRPAAEVAALLRCNLVASCIWRERGSGARTVGDGGFAGHEADPVVRCGGRELDPSTCPACFTAFERTSWANQGRNRLEVWSTEAEPLSVEVLVDALGLEEGMSLADVGAGAGWFTFPFARAVGPRGRILALELDPVFAELLTVVARDGGFPQVSAVLSDDPTPSLPPAALDRIWVAEVYPDLFLLDARAGVEPELGSTAAFTRALAAGLRPGGRLAVLEVGPQGDLGELELGFDQARLRAIIEDSGLVWVGREPRVVRAELHLFERPAPP